MPGNVGISTATTVLPYGLCSAWGEGFMFPIISSEEYADGSTQCRKDADVWRREWQLTRHLTWTEFTALRAFWQARRGCLEAFYFYPRKQDYDQTGGSSTGRYKVKFSGQITDEYGIGRMTMTLGLTEVP